MLKSPRKLRKTVKVRCPLMTQIASAGKTRPLRNDMLFLKERRPALWIYS